MWRLFAYMDDDETGVHDERRMVADWQLAHCLDWCASRGYDHVYFSRSSETTRFEKQPAPDDLVHHF